jgi:hypothetical protein
MLILDSSSGANDAEAIRTLLGCLLRFAGAGFIAALQLGVLLIALGRKGQSTIQKLVQQAQQFHLAVKFDRAVHEALALQEFPEVVLGHNHCPAEVGKCDPLGSAALTDFKITLLDVMARLGEQPLTKVPQDFLDMSVQFLDRDFAQLSSARGSFEFRGQLGREFVRMTLNQSYQP